MRLDIEAQHRTPKVLLDIDANRLVLAGESYPEDVTAFYQPVFEALNAHLETPPADFTFVCQLVYFNSSSAKALMMMIEKVDEAASNGTTARIEWYYDPDDEIMMELGEDFGDDVENATFELIKVDSVG